MKVLKVPYIDQSVRYPTGCESVSTVMLLQYLGIEITVDEFISKYLKCESFEERADGLYGPDPTEVFCGSPYSEDSFGCYASVIKETLGQVLEETCPGRYEVIDESGTSTEELLEKYIDNGMPVVFWACINMREPIVGPEWKLKSTGETFTWISNEHCMLLTGYDEEGYYFNDPYENNGVIRYPKKIVEDRHKAQHEMAVGVKIISK